MPGWISSAEVQQAVLDQLQRSTPDNSATLEPWWPGLIARANTFAYGEIRRRLAARGYLLAQITAWDDGPEFQQDLAVWRALSQAAAMAPDSYSLAALNVLDRRADLTGSKKDGIEAVQVTIAGVFQDPAGTAAQATTGAYDTNQDMFSWPDPDDDRIGEETVL